MKKLLTIIAALFAATFLFAAGANDTDSSVLVVGATPEPHAEMLKLIAPDLLEQGITLKIVDLQIM